MFVNRGGGDARQSLLPAENEHEIGGVQIIRAADASRKQPFLKLDEMIALNQEQIQNTDTRGREKVREEECEIPVGPQKSP